MMIQRRTKPHVSIAKDREVAEKRHRTAHRKTVEPVDHWAFLDEIEAPMWADLNLEATSSHKDDDNDWFRISHPFHRCSSRELRSALSHAGEAKAHLGLGIKGSSSPKLPPSVSRSRGKDYKSKDWNNGNFGIISSKQHPIKNLSGQSSLANSASDQKLKPKRSNGNGKETGRSKASDDNRKETDTSKATSVCESSLTESTRLNTSKPTTNFGESKTTSNSSTITCESSDGQHLKFCEVSNQAFGQTSGLLSALKVTLRKSCVTRQALRAESVGGRQSRGRKSSSGKSSVGSSSYPDCYAGNAIGGPSSKSKDATPHSIEVNRMSFANMDKVKLLTTSKKLNAESLATRCGSKTVTTKSSHEETAKSKVLQVVNSKVMRPRRENESLAAVTNKSCKTEARRYNGLRNGKENAKIRTPFEVGGVVQIRKVKKPNAPPKIDKRGLTAPKVKICSRDEKKSLNNVTRNIHFR